MQQVLTQISQQKNLLSLKLDGNQLTDNIIKYLVKVIRSSNVQSIDISNNQKIGRAHV